MMLVLAAATASMGPAGASSHEDDLAQVHRPHGTLTMQFSSVAYRMPEMSIAVAGGACCVCNVTKFMQPRRPQNECGLVQTLRSLRLLASFKTQPLEAPPRI